MRFVYILCLSLLLTLVPLCVLGAETLSYIPESCFSVITITNVQNDIGLSWLFDAWINSSRESPLRDLLSSMPAQEMSVALFPAEDEELFRMLIVINVDVILQKFIYILSLKLMHQLKLLI